MWSLKGKNGLLLLQVQCIWCWFGSARTRAFLPHSHAQITLKSCMHLQLSLYTLSIYIRKHHAQFSWCEDWKIGWCTKAHTNYFANSNKGFYNALHGVLKAYPGLPPQNHFGCDESGIMHSGNVWAWTVGHCGAKTTHKVNGGSCEWITFLPVQYFTRQCATPGNVPLVLVGIKKAYPVHNLLYSISRIIGPKEEPSSLMWPVEGDWNHVACHFLRLSATQCSKHPISCGFAAITMCMYATYMCDKFSVIVRSPNLRQWVTLIKFEGQSVNCRDPHTQWPHPSKRPQ